MGVEFRHAGALVRLPNPNFGDSEASGNQVNIQRTMTGGVFSYVKTKTQKTLKYSFSLSRKEYYALLDFYNLYCGELWQLINWKGEVWIGYLMNESLDVTEKRKYDNIVEIEFEGTRIA